MAKRQFYRSNGSNGRTADPDLFRPVVGSDVDEDLLKLGDSTVSSPINQTLQIGGIVNPTDTNYLGNLIVRGPRFWIDVRAFFASRWNIADWCLEIQLSSEAKTSPGLQAIVEQIAQLLKHGKNAPARPTPPNA